MWKAILYFGIIFLPLLGLWILYKVGAFKPLNRPEDWFDD